IVELQPFNTNCKVDCPAQLATVELLVVTNFFISLSNDPEESFTVLGAVISCVSPLIEKSVVKIIFFSIDILKEEPITVFSCGRYFCLLMTFEELLSSFA